jgi:HEAT repeat protein
LLNVALEYGRRTFEFVAAFAIVRGVAAGWDVRGELDRATVRKLAIPLDAASVFRTVALTRGSYVGPLPNDALTQHYLALLGRSPRTVFVWPIEVQSRLIAMLYGDCGSRPVSQRRLADFILFCQDLPSAFHDLIVFRRQTALVANTFDVEPQATAATPAAATTDAPADSEWYNGLLALLTGPDPAERSMAMLELMKTPAASAAALAKAFPGPTGWSRLPVVELPEPDELGPIPGALARLGEDGANALEPLLDSSDSDTRYLALLTSGSLPFANLVDGVMRGLFDFDPDVSSAARAAARALALIPNFQSALKDLRAELSSTDAIRRSLAARALGVLHDRAALPNLIELTGNEDELVATSAAEALKETTKVNWGPHPDAWRAWFAHAGERRRVEWLVSALSSDDADLRLSAIEELSKVFGDNHGFLADGPPPERLRAVERWESEIAARPDLDI